MSNVLGPRSPYLVLPCQCYAWKFGGAYGAILCGFHLHLHENSSPLVPCDCLLHRAERRGLAPFPFLEELYSREAASYAPKPDLSTLATKEPSKRRRTKRERDRKCDCLWLLKKGEWRIDSWCDYHLTKDQKWKAERHKERNEYGW